MTGAPKDEGPGPAVPDGTPASGPAAGRGSSRVCEVGQVSDIDGLTISICTEGDRVRLEVGSSVALLDAARSEEFGRLYIAAVWQANPQALGEPSW